MLEYDFENSVGFWICQASHALQRAFNEELAPQGVTYRQAQVLGCLALEGKLSQTDLAERMRIEPPTLVGILDRMEQGGWIRRDLSRLGHYVRTCARHLKVPIPHNYPIFGHDAFLTGTGVHAAAVIKAMRRGDQWLADRVYSGVPAAEFGEALVGLSGHKKVLQNGVPVGEAA